MKLFVKPACCLIVLSATSGVAISQPAMVPVPSEDDSSKAIYTAPVSGLAFRLTDGLFVYAATQVGMGSTSNVRSSETNARSSGLMVVRPHVVAEVKNSGNRYTLAYDGNYTNYNSDSRFNFRHHDITLAGDTHINARSRLALAIGSIDRTDEASSTNAASDVLDHWIGRNLRGLFVYGSQGAKGRIEVEGSIGTKRYENNRQSTVGANLDSTAVSGRYYWRVMPNTYTVAELRRIDNDYVNKVGSNIDTRALVGLTWIMTDITSGSLKVGQQRKKFDSQHRSTGIYEAQIQWAPRTYSKFTLNARRSDEDAIGIGATGVNTHYGIDWTHAWSESLKSTVSLSNTDTRYRHGNGRQDDTLNTTLGLQYEFKTNVGFILEFNNTDRDSNTAGYNFSRNNVFAGLQFAL